MEQERRRNHDRRKDRRLIPPAKVLGLYLLVVVSAVVILHRDSEQTKDTFTNQCESRNESRKQANERNAVIRKDFVLTRQVWQQIAAAQKDPHNRAEATSIAREYETLIAQVTDYEPVDCSKEIE